MSEVCKLLPMLDQLIYGLELFGFLETLRDKKYVLEPLFVAERSKCFLPTADLLLDNIDGQFSDEGSNHKAKEVDIFKLFTDFIQDCGEAECMLNVHLCENQTLQLHHSTT